MMTKAAARNSHPLIGAGVHWRDASGAVELQGAIIDIIPNAGGDIARLQFFEWFMGEPSTQRLILLTELASTDRWVLYSNVAEMNDHFERVDSRRRPKQPGTEAKELRRKIREAGRTPVCQVPPRPPTLGL